MGKAKRKQKPEAPIWHWFNDICLDCYGQKNGNFKNCRSCKSAKEMVAKQKEKEIKRKEKRELEYE